MRHDHRTFSPDTIRKTALNFDHDRETEIRQREGDQKFIIALAKAFQRGDHIRAGEPKPLRLIG